MSPHDHSFARAEEEQRSRKLFSDGLGALRKKLNAVEERCVDKEILRDALSIAMDGYCRQIDSIERACERYKAKYETEEPLHGNDD